MALDPNLQRVEEAMEALVRVSQGRGSASTRAVRAGVQMTGAAQKVLRSVLEDEPVRISDLARQLHMGDAAVSRQVTTLEEQGWVVRVSSPDDGRVAMVRSTAAGRRAGGRLRRAADEIFREHLLQWGERDLSKLAGLMERLVRDLRDARRAA
jgi:DNA-binding MarR family transcriptional regulator